MIDLEMLKTEFSDAADKFGISGWPCSLECQVLEAPHRQIGLPAGYGAVYGFALHDRCLLFGVNLTALIDVERFHK